MAPRRGRRPLLLVGGLAALLTAVCAAAMCQSLDEFEEAPINYSKSPPKDAIAALQSQLDRKQVTLAYDPVRGYLPALLKQLNVPVSSQTLVFSKTSFQRERISPQTPRALYFNDAAYVGWEQDAPVLEISTADPQLGAVFYTLKQDAAAPPKFIRQTQECLGCHGSALSRGVPGHVMRSVFTDGTGMPILEASSFITTDESPLKERWGGWYVTGTHGDQRHMGNLITHSAAQAENANLSLGANVTDLRRRLDLSPYLTRSSDIVALMVAEHQTHVQNLITRLNFETRRGMQYEQTLGKVLGMPEGGHLESTEGRIKSVGEPLVQALLFTKEAPLTSPVAGTSTFARDFTARGPRDHLKRSLRDLDLKRRLFKYPCSYLVYSEAFDALPPLAKDFVYRRLWEVLSGKDTTPAFANLTPEDRAAIREILLETKPEFATRKPG